MMIPMLCVTGCVRVDVGLLLLRVARLMSHTPAGIRIFVGVSMVQLVAVFVSVLFQAEGGIRDLTVTGVQTCALPISAGCQSERQRRFLAHRTGDELCRLAADFLVVAFQDNQHAQSSLNSAFPTLRITMPAKEDRKSVV